MTEAEGKSFTGGLHDLATEDWFTDVANSSVWVRIYTSLFIPRDRFTELVGLFSQGLLHRGQPFLTQKNRIAIAFGTVHDVKVPFTICEQVSRPRTLEQ